MPARLPFRLSLLIPALSLLAACNTPAARIDDKKAVFDRYPAEVQQKLAAGQIGIGYTPEQAEIALGPPNRRYTRTSAGGTQEVWIYRERGSQIYSRHAGYVGRISGFSTLPATTNEKRRVVFAGGKVALIEEAIR